MYKELEIIVLRRDLEQYDLAQGDIGTVVHVYKKGGYEVEFMTVEGDTIAVITLGDDDIRPTARREILHVRELERAPV